MCSWCWGFRPAWNRVQQALTGKLNIQYVLGGLAPDTDQPMSESMKNNIRDNWQRIQQSIPGIEFNYDFWSLCRPRRSTYPACRAVIASKMQRPLSEKQMILAIQQAYYLAAKNPSDDNVLLELARNMGLDVEKFSRDLNGQICRNNFEKDLMLTKKLHVSAYPSLVLSHADQETTIDIDYTNSEHILNQISHKLKVFS